MPLPPGYVLDQPQQPEGVSLPTGFTLDSPSKTVEQPKAQVGISAQPKPQGVRDKVSRWAQNVMDDIKYGTDLTGVGTVLQKMGAHGVYNGQPEAVGDFMASLPLGLARVVKGAAEMNPYHAGSALAGMQDTAAGALQASQIPSAFMGAEPAAEGLAQAGSKAAELIPSATRAGKAFQQVKALAGDIPIDLRGPAESAMRAEQLQARGAGSPPQVMSKFLLRARDPENMGPVTYKEARDFYSNATSKLSPDEAMKLSPQMRRQMADFTAKLNSAIGQAADQVGQLQNYQQAMHEYHQAMRLKGALETVKDAATSKVGKAAAAGLGLGAGSEIVRKIASQ